MNHDDALRLSASERYLLGDLDEDLRDQFEEHFFDCTICAIDVRSGAAMLDQMKIDLSRPTVNHEQAKQGLRLMPKERKKLFFLQPAWAVGAIAALLLLIGYQNMVQMPRLKTEVAAMTAPELLPTLAVKGVSRSDQTLSVAVGANKPLLLKVDIPTQDRFAGYELSLYTPASNPDRKIAVSPEQAKDTLYIQIPPQSVHAGDNKLVIEGIVSNGSARVELATRHFEVQSGN